MTVTDYVGFDNNIAHNRIMNAEVEMTILEDARDIIEKIKSISDTNCSGEFMLENADGDLKPPLSFFCGTIIGSIIGHVDRAETRINEREANIRKRASQFRQNCEATGEIDGNILSRLKTEAKANELERELAWAFAKAGKEAYLELMGKDWEPYKPKPEVRKATASEIAKAFEDF